jgi:AraC-like DNA-binding protein
MNEVDFPELAAWRRLAALPDVREKQVAFICATGIPLVLAPSSILAPQDEIFRITGCTGGPSGAICREKLLRAERRSVMEKRAVRYRCPSGLMKIQLPVFIGGRHAGSLIAGPFTSDSPEGNEIESGPRVTQPQNAWNFTTQVTWDGCRAVESLLATFGKQLEKAGNKLLRSHRRPALALETGSLQVEWRNVRASMMDLATRVDLSPCHFCSVFKRQTGLRFNQYQMRLRLDKARELLDDRRRRISEVAAETGFESIPYFNRMFQRRFRCSPTEYRKNGHAIPESGTAGFGALSRIPTR